MSGTSQAVTEASGSITVEETVPNRLRYNGQMADGLTGLYYLRARYYNASLGRFTQEDVIYNDGLNLYAYCNSNPVMYSDPSGFAAKSTPKGCNPKNGGEKDSKGVREPEIVLPSRPHTNGTQGHWETILDEVDVMKNSGDYKKIYVNKGLSNEIPGAKPNRRPDIMGVRNNGLIDQVEVPSKTDVPDLLIDRMVDNQRIIGERAGNIKVRNIGGN